MTETQWAEFAGLGFALAVLAWVIYRLTGSMVSIFKQSFPPPSTQDTGDPVDSDERPDDKGA